jgi:aryl-alcohol dehydrogenase-like predicted oxidoreductase
MDQKKLGRSNVTTPLLGIGTWAWGDTMVWGYDKRRSDDDLRRAFQACLDAGLTFFDTAEVYGRGRSEQLLGIFRKEAATNLVLATKFMPYPWRLNRNDLLTALRRSLDRLGVPTVDLYQIHWPIHIVPMTKWLDAMAEAVGSGLIRAVGVSNYSAVQMERAHAWLARHRISLASNQVEYSLVVRKPERNGVLQTCRDLDVTLIAYSPLAMGVLTGKYSASARLPGIRGRRFPARLLAWVQPLLDRLRDIGAQHGGKTVSQVALNWLICRGVLPIPGAKNPHQATENAGALGWSLTDREVDELDELSSRV